MDLATLRERQEWTLEQKIDHAVGAVEQFKARTGRPLYVSFSGGKAARFYSTFVVDSSTLNRKRFSIIRGTNIPKLFGLSETRRT